jgi:hypothetical protein
VSASAGSRPELSCRFLVPLIAIARERLPAGELDAFLACWQTDVAALSQEEGWVSLRFCEELVEWLEASVGEEAIIERTLRDVLSPASMGILYPIFRAFGSPRLGYGRLPMMVGLLNRVSDVRVLAVGRNRATISYGPRTDATRERSPLICRVRRAQLAAWPTVWELPAAVVEEGECQAHGGDRCVYRVTWVEPARWGRWLLAGGASAGLTWLVSGHLGAAAALAFVVGVTCARLWGLRNDRRDLRALEDLERSLRPRISSEPRAGTDPQPPVTVTTPISGEMAASVPAPPQPGQLLGGRYRLQTLLGAGGMGFVYAAVDEVARETIAVKLLRPELSLNPRWVGRMEREVRIARMIRHPHVCRVMSFGQVDGYSFLTMELASGGSLHRELRMRGADYSWEARLADANAIVLGLVAVHDAGILHRDLTPQNILRFSDGRLAIADFGLALDEPEKTTVVAGTPNYTAPEVRAGGNATFASDVWQLGTIMHEVLFGGRPAALDRAPDSASAAVNEPAAVSRGHPLLELCLQCVDGDPARRPANAAEVARALAQIDHSSRDPTVQLETG